MSNLPLKAFTDGADVTSLGRLFHRLTKSSTSIFSSIYIRHLSKSTEESLTTKHALFSVKCAVKSCILQSCQLDVGLPRTVQSNSCNRLDMRSPFSCSSLISFYFLASKAFLCLKRSKSFGRGFAPHPTNQAHTAPRPLVSFHGCRKKGR